MVMLMALGSCCLVTCCNCMRLGATIMMGYGDRNDSGGQPEQPMPRPRNGKQHPPSFLDRMACSADSPGVSKLPFSHLTQCRNQASVAWSLYHPLTIRT